MCLYHFRKVTLKEDLVVYKVLVEHYGFWHFVNGEKTIPTIIRSPYYPDTTWELGVEYRQFHHEPQIETVHRYPAEKTRAIFGNCFHSFATEEDAFRAIEQRIRGTIRSGTCAVYKAIIPADSFFVYRGTSTFDGGSLDSYASQMLKIIEKVG